jgi:predicted regulator of Ras-like GTPase activity (Roadblock/LC7/MglB family)
MKYKEDMIVSDMHENISIILLKKIISDLRDETDIEGVCIVDQNDEIIASDLPETSHYESDITEIMQLINEGDGYSAYEQSKVLFSQRILDYNGCKILAKKIRDKLTLLVMIHKRGYISLAMLDIENSIRKIDEVMHGSRHQPLIA